MLALPATVSAITYAPVDQPGPPFTVSQADLEPACKALNSYRETFPGISYTEVYTHTGEVVQPNSDGRKAS